MSSRGQCHSIYCGIGVLLILAIIHFRIGSSQYIGVACGGDHTPVNVQCEENEIIRVHRTVLSFVPAVPGQNDPSCDDIDTNDYCHAYTNLSDVEFVGRRSASFAIRSEDLQNHPEKQGNCINIPRSNVVQLYYECVPKEQSSRLNSICADVTWENEFDGFITSPYFPGDFPSDEDDLECECELRPESGSRVELTALLINPSTSGTTWNIEVSTGSDSQDLSGSFRVSRPIPLSDSTSTVYLRFTSQGSGTQQPSRTGPPAGFWLQYKAFGASVRDPDQFYYDDLTLPPGKVTLYCNDPPPLYPLTAGAIAGIVIGSIVFVALVVFIIWCCVVRSKKGKSYRADDEPHVYSGKTNHAMNDDPGRRRKQAEMQHSPPTHHPHYHISPRMSDEDYPEKEPYSGRSSRGRSYSNNSYNDKVFLDDVDKKSLPSSGQTGDNDSIAKKSLSTDSQADNYSEVNYSPKAQKALRFSGSSIGRDTAV